MTRNKNHQQNMFKENKQVKNKVMSPEKIAANKKEEVAEKKEMMDKLENKFVKSQHGQPFSHGFSLGNNKKGHGSSRPDLRVTHIVQPTRGRGRG